MKGILKAVWLFCSYLFVPQWGRNKGNTDDTDLTDDMDGIASLEIGQKSERKSFKGNTNRTDNTNKSFNTNYR